jgi:hypothetical protein
VTNVQARQLLGVISISSRKPVKKTNLVYYQDGAIFSIPLLRLMD